MDGSSSSMMLWSVSWDAAGTPVNVAELVFSQRETSRLLYTIYWLGSVVSGMAGIEQVAVLSSTIVTAERRTLPPPVSN